MRKLALLLAAGLIAFAAAGPLAAQCATSFGYSATTNYRNVIVSWSTNFAQYAGDVAGGMNLWNNGCGQMSGNNYPIYH
jgi:hypothetical protein